MRSMTSLLIGGTSQVGIDLYGVLQSYGMEIVSPSRAALDISHPGQLRALLEAHKVDVAINCAAYTAVDAAESDVQAAWSLNAVWPAVLAVETRARSIPVVHVSTDYVFDGRKPTPYIESDPVNPINVYGASKLGGEYGIRANPKHAILRTSWVVSPHRSNFVKTMLRLAAERPSLRVVADQVGAPTIAFDLARTIGKVAWTLASHSSAPSGTWHVSNAGYCSWADLAIAAMEGARVRGLASVPVEQISASDYKTAASRPANSCLAIDQLEQDWKIRPRHWRIALEEVLDAVKVSGLKPLSQ